MKFTLVSLALFLVQANAESVTASKGCSKFPLGKFKNDHQLTFTIAEAAPSCLEVQVYANTDCIGGYRDDSLDCLRTAGQATADEVCDSNSVYFQNPGGSYTTTTYACNDYNAYLFVKNDCDTEQEIAYETNSENVVDSLCDLIKDAGQAIGTALIIIIVVIVLILVLGILGCCACCSGCPLYGKCCCGPKVPPPQAPMGPGVQMGQPVSSQM